MVFQFSGKSKKHYKVCIPGSIFAIVISSRETLLLHFKNQTSESQRYVVTNVICHELGHQCK